MTWRQVVAVILLLAGVFVPAGFLLARFGTDARLALGGPEATSQLLAMAVGYLFTLACALGGALLLRQERDLLHKLTATAVETLTANRRQAA
jgi:hypothetical protein